MSFIFVLSLSSTCFGAGLDYLSHDKWIENNENISSKYIEEKSADDTLFGVYKYYIDYENRCIYNYFSITESSITYGYTDIKISYDINDKIHHFTFAVNENSMVDCGKDEEENFTVYENFVADTETNGGTLVSIVEFNDNYLPTNDSKVKISLNVNGHSYKIDSSTVIPAPAVATKTVKTTKAKTTKTTENRNKTGKKEVTTKFVPKAVGSANKSSKSKSSKSTTKFKSSMVVEQNGTTAVINNNRMIQPQKEVRGTGLSTTAKVLIGISIALVFIGLSILISSISRKTNPPENQE